MSASHLKYDILPANMSIMQQQTKRKRIESLYVLKAICAFFVVYIHVSGDHPLLMPIIGVGTPCFLAITGYLLYSADSEREVMKCKKWAFKAFWLACCCALLYMIAYYIKGENYFQQSLSFHIQNMLLGNMVSGHLWYLTANWQALLVLVLVVRYIPKTMYVLPLMFLVAFYLRTYYDPFHPGTGALRNNFLVTSLPFLATGYLVHKHEEWLTKKLNVKLCLLVSLIAVSAEFMLRLHFGLRYSYFMLSSYPLVVSLMLTCVIFKDFTLPILGKIGKTHSPNIYYFHILFIGGMGHYLSIQWPSELLALTAYVLCIPFSICFNFTADCFIQKILPCFRRLGFRREQA